MDVKPLYAPGRALLQRNVACRHWGLLPGACLYGSQCKFAHNPGDRASSGKSAFGALNEWFLRRCRPPSSSSSTSSNASASVVYSSLPSAAWMFAAFGALNEWFLRRCRPPSSSSATSSNASASVVYSSLPSAAWMFAAFGALNEWFLRPPSSSSATSSNASASNLTETSSSQYSRPEYSNEPLNSSAPPPFVPYTPCSAPTSVDLCNAYGDNVKNFTWDQVLDMTNGLTSTQLGKGGFGSVYLGKLSGLKKVAVKVLDESSQQGIPEFVNEVNLLKGLNHENLVRLLGYCQDLKKVLIYEFAEEGSLWDHLHGGRSRLDWRQRLRIALQSACGLEYLHTGCNPTIFHRDIKSENILITKGMIAKVADFGISKVGSDQDHIRRTHVTTMIKGTLGYLDPEYLRTGQLTNKSDVYSFGVLLLEIVTGRKPIQTSEKITSIIDWVNKQKGKAVADRSMKGHFNPKALKQVLRIAKECTQLSGADRPDMKKVVRVLEAAQIAEDEKKSSWPWFST